MSAATTDPLTDLEPAIAQMLDKARAWREQPPYRIQSLPDVQQSLQAFLGDAPSLDQPRVENLKRMGGGASKEQFVFDLREAGSGPTRCVLRMDPLESAVTTSREREYAILDVMQNVIPVPRPLWADYTGDKLGRPALITSFIQGVTKPSNSNSNVSGFGTVFDQPTRERLSVPFIKHFAGMHAVDWRSTAHDAFQAPIADVQQAARWQVSWWTKVWRDDSTEGHPLMGLAERWLRDHLPAATPDDLVFVHSDYRTGNYLYDEGSLEITAILDWELVHIGDYHEDLAWAAIRSWSTVENGTLLASGLMTLDQLCERYSGATGRIVDMKTLYFYQVLGLYKCVVICLATSINAARRAHNHQDILLSWLAAAGYAFLSDLHALLERGSTR